MKSASPDSLDWTQTLRKLYARMLKLYQTSATNAADSLTFEEKKFLAGIGLTPIQLIDYVEDVARAGEPSWEMYLLLAAERRDYFLFVQNSVTSSEKIDNSDIPAKKDELGGISWLPRIIYKAEHFLKGRLDAELMFGCGGDRPFLKSHGLNLADFLRMVRALDGDPEKVLGAFKSRSTQFQK
ncbi:MAG: hypothetical protein ACK5LK_06090 [Chthoniobacterales bacterium]